MNPDDSFKLQQLADSQQHHRQRRRGCLDQEESACLVYVSLELSSRQTCNLSPCFGVPLGVLFAFFFLYQRRVSKSN
jgi:hypothetical protein